MRLNYKKKPKLLKCILNLIFNKLQYSLKNYIFLKIRKLKDLIFKDLSSN